MIALIPVTRGHGKLGAYAVVTRSSVIAIPRDADSEGKVNQHRGGENQHLK